MTAPALFQKQKNPSAPRGQRANNFAVPPLIRRPLAKTASFLRCNGRPRARLLVRSVLRRSDAGSEGYSPAVSLPLPPYRGFSSRSARRLLGLFIAVLGSILTDRFQIVNLLMHLFLLHTVKILLFSASSCIKALFCAVSVELCVPAAAVLKYPAWLPPDSLCA